MAHGLTVTNLISDIKRRITVPTNQSLFSNTDFIEFMNDELFTNLVPFIMSAREEYFVTYEDIPYVANQNAYDIPELAIGIKTRDIVEVDANGNVTDLPRLSLEEVNSTTITNSNYTRGFYTRGNKIIVLPTPTATGSSLRVYYYRRPNRLAYTTSGGVVTAVNTNTNTITLSSVPTDWSGSTSIDVQSETMHFDLIFDNVAIVTLSGTDITLSDVTGINIGDYVYAHGYCAVPMIPVELHPLLAQAAGIKCLEALGDEQAVAVAERKYQSMMQNVSKLLVPRNDGSPKKVVQMGGCFEVSNKRIPFVRT